MFMLRPKPKGVNCNQNKGFTIIELIIAAGVFSTILLLTSIGIIEIGKVYYKGITSSRTQETARAIMEDVSRSLQFNSEDAISAGSGSFGSKAYCIGSERYSYIIDRQVNPSHATNKHALWVDKKGLGEACAPVNLSASVPSAGGRELVPTNMRLLKFNINSLSSGSYAVNIGIGYGDNDLLTLYDDNGINRQNVVAPPAIDEADAGAASCKSSVSGRSFCAVAALDTVVKKRL
jgi:prepilin-type N-terminal cleavage/methylation domain-containing protein